MPYKKANLPLFLSTIRDQNENRRRDAIYCFGIFERVAGSLIGQIQIAFPLRFNVQSARLSFEIYNNHWRQGFGKESVSAAIRFAFAKLKLHRLESEIQPRNAASIALARSVGMHFEGVRKKAVYFDGKWHDHAIYAITAENYGIIGMKPFRAKNRRA